VPVDRRHVILERVADEQTIHVGALARELGVSEMTIRRDIRRLERDGFLRQTYGGATAHLTRAPRRGVQRSCVAAPARSASSRCAASLLDGA
jgi:DeoR/GlpR family transcriptional regulator of sugar metabolism